MIFFPSFFSFVFLSGITFSKQNRTTVSWILGGLLIGRFWKFKQFFLGVSLPGGATRTRLFDWVRWSSYAQISFPKEIIKQEEHLIYGGSVQSLLDHTWHFQLAFFQPFLDLVDMKIIPDFGRGLKFGWMLFQGNRYFHGNNLLTIYQR